MRVKETKAAPSRQLPARQAVKAMRPDAIQTVADFLAASRDACFQTRQLGLAFDVWQRALSDTRCLIVLGITGPVLPAGMRDMLVQLVKQRLVDVIVSTGSNLYHDIYQTLGLQHYQHDSTIVADETRIPEVDGVIVKFARWLDKRPYSTREFFHLFGQHLYKIGKFEGVLMAATRQSVPIYVPGIPDSEFGLAFTRQGGNSDGKQHRFVFDLVRDAEELVTLTSTDKYSLAEIHVGAGAPRTSARYVVNIANEIPHWGTISNVAAPDAAGQDGNRVVVHTEASLALAMLVTGLHQVSAAQRRPFVPLFSYEPKLSVSFVKRGGLNERAAGNK